MKKSMHGIKIGDYIVDRIGTTGKVVRICECCFNADLLEVECPGHSETGYILDTNVSRIRKHK